ncbi:uncharacterized protein N7477_010213 [Penicillium maclennaniae]|uniref:uncharacterized protein n=1 Tax=Penicillium maclennaniae TaxID=1343394 RepID=UPI00253FA98F|nr:uncharacterized protein N7477_010213 [Penicillium maclennaniae]KAJ5662597.1 hypothetical protein N7477_010213 [Penicillium maclennaniae]
MRSTCPDLPSLGWENDVNSYLSLKWAVINGSLYANEDRVFPPSMSMQLHAPQREGPAKTLVMGDEIELSYALEARPLSTEENGSTSTIVRVRVDLFDFKGESVTTDAVIVDLLSRPDGSNSITRIRMEPTKKHNAGRFHHDRPWRMNVWPTIFSGKDKQGSSPEEKTQPTTSIASDNGTPSRPQSANAATSSAAQSRYGFIFSPYWSPTTYTSRPYHHSHGGHRDHKFMRLMRPVILPAVLGAIAGLIACLVGFVLGHLFMTLSVYLGLRKRPGRQTRTRFIDDEIDAEKAQLLPQIHVTEVDPMDA